MLLVVYAALVFAFQFAVLTKQIAHDEIQDVITVEGLLYFDQSGTLQLRQDYYSRPQSHLLVDRLMEVRDASGSVLYRSPNLANMSLGGEVLPGEGDADFGERRVKLQDGTHVLLVSHIHGMNGRQLIIRLGYSLGPLQQRMWQFLMILLVAIPVALIIAWMSGQAIARKALRPVDEMGLRAAGITATNLHDRLLVANPHDELGQLATAFNRLLDRLQQSFEQLQRFTADAAHELRTPLAALRTIGEVALQHDEGSTDPREALSSILEETSRLSETIDSLLLLAKAEAAHAGIETEICPLSVLVSEVLEVLEVVVEEKRMTVAETGNQLDANIKCNRSLLRTALMNVLHNAIKFSPERSELSINYQFPQVDPAAVQLIVLDQGPGIRAGEFERVFERFYTSSARATAGQSGAGLGLSVAKLIIERIGGSIQFEEGVVQGSKCVIGLPLASERT